MTPLRVGRPKASHEPTVRIEVGATTPPPVLGAACDLCGRQVWVRRGAAVEGVVCPDCAPKAGGPNVQLVGVLPKPRDEQTAPKPPTRRERRAERRLFRLRARARERSVGILRRRLASAKSVLDVLQRSDLPRGVETDETIRRWERLDAEEEALDLDEFMADLSVLFPNADDAELRTLVEKWRVRPKAYRAPNGGPP